MNIGKINLVAILSCTAALFSGCGSDADGHYGSATINAGSFSYAPAPAEVGVAITVSGSVTNQEVAGTPTTWAAVRDGTVTVATGTLAPAVGIASVPLVFTDTIPVPGAHDYVVTVSSGGTVTSRTQLAVPVQYNLSPGIAIGSSTNTEVSLTLTLTNNGAGNTAFPVPYSITTQGLAGGIIEYFDLSTTPLTPGASTSRTLILPQPVSGTYTFTVDPEATLGTNQAGMPAMAFVIIGSG